MKKKEKSLPIETMIPLFAICGMTSNEPGSSGANVTIFTLSKEF